MIMNNETKKISRNGNRRNLRRNDDDDRLVKS